MKKWIPNSFRVLKFNNLGNGFSNAIFEVFDIILMPMPSARRNFIFAGEKKFGRRKVKFRWQKINFMK